MIRVTQDSELSKITIDRPDRRNALNWDMIGALGDAIAESDADPHCHCIVSKGT